MRKKILSIIFSCFLGMNTSVWGDCEQKSTIGVFKDQKEADTLYQDMYNQLSKRYNFDTSFKFKQENLNHLVCETDFCSSTEAICYIFTNNYYFIFQTDNLNEITSFEIKLLKDEEFKTVFQETWYLPHLVYKDISYDTNCRLKVHTENPYDKDKTGYTQTLRRLKEGCSMHIEIDKKFERKTIREKEKELRQKTFSDTSFRFRQPAMNYLMCEGEYWPLCSLYFKNEEMSIALKDKDSLTTSAHIVLINLPDETIIKNWDVDGNPIYTKIEPRGTGPCYLNVLWTNNINNFKTGQYVSHKPYFSLAPFCYNLRDIDKHPLHQNDEEDRYTKNS